MKKLEASREGRDPNRKLEELVDDLMAHYDEDAAGPSSPVFLSKYCPECGKQHPSIATACRECGVRTRERSIVTRWPTEAGALDLPTVDIFRDTWSPCVACSMLLPDDMPFCPACGAPPEGGVTVVSAPIPRRVLGSKWVLESLVSEGAFGFFFKAHHEILGMEVGVKVLKGRFTSTDAGRRQFHEEAMRLSRLRHPHIVQVIDFGEEDDLPYLVMEYLPGKPLHSYLSLDYFGLEDGIEVLRRVGTALMEAHGGSDSEGPLVHLDLKPEHVFVERVHGEWNVKVIDFGIAEIVRHPEEGTVSEKDVKVAGTFPYMAPERWKGVVDPRCDIYSLGVILYEFVAGRLPFEAPDPWQMRKLHEEVVPRRPSEHRSGPKPSSRQSRLLRQLDDIILRTLEKDPAGRPPDVGILVRTLEQWLEKWRQAGVTDRRTWREKVRGLLVTAAVVCAGLLAAFLWDPFVELIPLAPTIAQERFVSPGHSLPLQAAISGSIHGPSYEGDPVQVALTRMEGVKEGIVIEVGRVTGGRVDTHLPWDRIAKKLEGRCDRETWLVSLIVKGAVRTVRSEPLEAVLDSVEPTVDLLGDFSAMEESGEKTLWLRTAQLTLVASEPLGRIEVNGRDLTAGLKGNTLAWSPAADDESVEITVADLHRISATYRWRLRWDEPARVRQEQRIQYINDPESHVLFELDREPAGGPEVAISGRPVEPEAAGDGGRRYRVRLEQAHFDDARIGAEGEKTIEIIVTTWSRGGRKGSRADSTISVSCLERTLEIVRSTGDGSEARKDPRTDRFRLESEGKPVLDADWDVTLLDSAVIESEFDEETGRIRLKEPDASFQGIVTLLLKAWDKFGNGVVVAKKYYPGPTPQLSLGLADDLGTRGHPLRAADCLSRKGAWEEETLRFRGRIVSRLLENPVVEIVHEKSDARWEVKNLDSVDEGVIELEQPIRLGEILPRLDACTDELKLRVTAPSGTYYSDACFVYTQALRPPKITPPEGPQPGAYVSVRAEPVAACGSIESAIDPVERVDIGGGAGRWEAGAWIRSVPLLLGGYTQVPVEMFFERDSEEYTDRRTYWRLPEDGKEYLVEFPPGSDLHVRVRFLGEGNGDFFLLGSHASRDVLSFYRRAVSGARAGQNAPRDEVYEMLDWLEKRFSVQAQLPLSNDLAALSAPVDKGTLGGRREWIGDRHSLGAAFAEWRDDGSFRKLGTTSSDDSVDFLFRLMIPYTGTDSFVGLKTVEPGHKVN